MHLAQKVLARLLLVVLFVAEVGTLANLCDRRPFARVERKQTHNQVLEVLGELGALDSLEVRIVALVLDHIVVLVFEDLGAVGELTLDHDEEKDTHREQINSATIVHIVGEDLRGNVTG